MWCDLVGCAVTGEESNGNIIVREDVDWGGWKTPGRGRVDDCDRDVAFEAGESCAADNCDVDGSWREGRLECCLRFGR